MTATTGSQATDIYERSNLTRLQLLFWVGQRLRPEIPLFNAIQIFTIPTAIDLQRFRRAFDVLLEHSDALRTVLEEVDGVPQQRVVSGFSNPLDMLDFSDAADPELAFQSWLQQRRVAAINLRERAFDAALIKIAADRFVWYLNQHHIITDAASSFLAFERLAKFYESPPAEQTLTESSPHTFAEYAGYERAYRSSPQYARAAAYWDKKLTPPPEPILLFGQLPARRTSQVQRVSYDLGSERSKKLRELARSKGIFAVSEELSLFSVFAALFYAQLHSLSGSRRLGLLVPVHNRFSPAFKDMLGLIMEYCPIQIEVAQEDSFTSLIAKVKREVRESFTHYQYSSGLALQDQAFDIIFNMYQVPALQWCGLPVHVERVYPGYGSERLALHVNDSVSTGEFVLHFDFSCDAFNDVQSEQMVREYVQLIDTFLEDVTQCISQVDLLQTEWNTPSLRSSPLDVQDQRIAIPTTGILERAVIAPRDDIECQLVEIWERVLGINPIGVRDNFFDLGGSSWLAVRLFSEIEKVTGTPIPLHILVQAGTVEELAEKVREQREPAPWSPLVAIQSRGTKAPFFCVHGAGGHILLFEKVARHLGADQPFYAFQAQGIEAGQEPFKRVEEMAALYVKTLRDFQPDGPYYLGGYSMGAMVAFEMAQQLQAQSQKVAMLVVIDLPAQSPHLKYVRQFADWLGVLLRMSSDGREQLFLHIRHYLFRLSYFGRLTFAAKIAYLRGKLGLLGQKIVRTRSKQEDTRPANVADLPAESTVDAQAKKRIRNLFILNDQAFRAYIPRRYPGRVAIIRSARGYTGDADKDYSPDPYLGWRRVLPGIVETYEVPGDHNEMIREPHVRLLAEHLRTSLENAQRQLHGPDKN